MTASIPRPWTAEGMASRRNYLFTQLRQVVRNYISPAGEWLSPPAVLKRADPRVLVELSLPLLLGDNTDQELAEKLLLGEKIHIPYANCAFCTEYVLATRLSAGTAWPARLDEKIRQRHIGKILYYARKDLQFHGYNDNHVTLATSSLILGGEWLNDKQAVAEGRANLLNFRDTFLRRGFMHETNDCYIPHTLYPIALIAEFSQDSELRQLATNCEERIWFDLLGHWHPNLSRKAGPSARDYTGGRLHQQALNALMWIIFGDELIQPVFQIDDLFIPPPVERTFTWNGDPEDNTWLWGFVSRVAAHPYHVPEAAYTMVQQRKFPHQIEGLHEVGHFAEDIRVNVTNEQGVKTYKSTLIPGVQHFGGRPIHTYQHQETDWVMGTASQRMIGSCSNNNWSVCWRKTQPLSEVSAQNQLYCSFTINDKRVTGRHELCGDPNHPEELRQEGVVHWSDHGMYAGIQHNRTAIMLYRPRILDRNRLQSLSTTLVFPLCHGNSYDAVYLGDQLLSDFTGNSSEVTDIFIADGPLFIGIKPLLSRPQHCQGARIVARREPYWGTIDIYVCNFTEPRYCEEIDLARLGGGFICEVATTDDFTDLKAFQQWFRQAKVLDDQTAFMRQVRYQRPGCRGEQQTTFVTSPGLMLGLRYDLMGDSLVYRCINGRELIPPVFRCSGVADQDVPWLTGDVSDFDHIEWAKLQAERTLAEHCQEPGWVL